LEKANALREEARSFQIITMKDDLRRMKRVLKRLGYINDKGVLQLKGRFCCEITTADEVVLTDMVFDGVFNDLTPEQAVGLLSCFVHKEPSKDTNPKIRSDLEVAFKKLRDAARAIAQCSVEAKLTLDADEYVSSFNPAMIDVAYAWAAGAKFVDVCRLTDIFEGSIIRTLKRLEELMRQLASAALAIGNVELKQKFEDGADKIRRGVVFAASLYL
jgi:ATP-dependent RNA helicase DOB1